MKLKSISKFIVFGILLNNMNINSFASVLSDDTRYETFIGNNIIVDNILEEEKVDVEIEGNTLVNIVPNKWAGSSWQTCRRLDDYTLTMDFFESVQNLYFEYDNLKANTIYTSKINQTDLNMCIIGVNEDGTAETIVHYKTTDTLAFNTSNYSKIRVHVRENGIFGVKTIKFMMLEGDYTNKEIPSYFEGIQSSFENNLVTQEMIDSGEGKIENLGKYKVEIKSTGKNKFNGKFEVGSIGPDGNNLESDTAYRSVDYIDVKNINSLLSNYNLNYFWYDSNKNLIGEVLYGVKSGTIVKKPYGAKYLRIYRGSLVSDLQLEESFVVTEYEPYKESTNTFYLNSPLLEEDIIEIINSQATHIKKYEKVVLDGSELWETFSKNNDLNIFNYYVLIENKKPCGYILNDRLNTITTQEWQSLSKVGIINGSDGIGITSNIPTLKEFKEWLSENPIEVIYELENPIYQPIKGNLSTSLFEGTTHISNSSNIPANMEITVDRTLNRAVEAIELAKSNPTIENLSKARMWINLAKESIKKDELQNEINNITNIEDLEIKKKTATANVDIYVKSDNALSMTLSTNSIMFEDYSGVSDIEKLNALEITVNSSLPYDLNAYLESEIQNSDKSASMDSNLFQIKESNDLDYKTFVNTVDKIILKEDCSSGNYNRHSMDLKIEGSNAYKADVYKTVIKFEAQQK